MQWPVHAKSLGNGEEPYSSMAAMAAMVMRSHGMCLLPAKERIDTMDIRHTIALSEVRSSTI